METRDTDIVYRVLPPDAMRTGQIDVDLVLDGKAVSTCGIFPLTLYVGAARVRMDGIGDVGTDRAHRHRGYSRRVLTAAIARMAADDAALSTLYGIPDFYPKFGYATAGPEYYYVAIPVRVPTPALPPGWQVRPVTAGDVATCEALYAHEAEQVVGAAVRPSGRYPWTELERTARGEGTGACRVVLDPAGTVAAYAWQGYEFWAAHNLTYEHRQSLVLGEVVARDTLAAEAVLTVCQSWAAAEAQRRGRPVMEILLSVPPESPVSAAAMHWAATMTQRHAHAAEFMVRTVHVGRLLEALAPELTLRLRAAHASFQGVWGLETELGRATVLIGPEGVAVDDRSQTGTDQVVRLPQTTLARLALGSFDPHDLLTRLEQPPSAEVRDLLAALFPRRHPYIYLPDRF